MMDLVIEHSIEMMDIVIEHFIEMIVIKLSMEIMV